MNATKQSITAALTTLGLMAMACFWSLVMVLRIAGQAF
jgi:hypothetical protein